MADHWIVPFTDFPAQYHVEKAEIEAIVAEVFSAGMFVGGKFVSDFEAAAAQYLDVPHVIGVGSGTDALILSLLVAGIKPGDEVITQSNSFVATAAAIAHVGAIPVFAELGPDLMLDLDDLERRITGKTRAIMPVHLTGKMPDMDRLMAIASRHQLLVIEDAAQAIGSTWNGKKAGTFGLLGCFSAHPLKNLNAAGDAGFIATHDPALAQRLKRLRNHGHDDRETVVEFGVASRLDGLQARLLQFRLSKLEDLIATRRANAQFYREQLQSLPILLPAEMSNERHGYHLFVIQTENRDQLMAHLAAAGIRTKIHYPVPIHLQPAATRYGFKRGDLPMTEKQAGQILSLPIHSYLSNRQKETLVKSIHSFYV